MIQAFRSTALMRQPFAPNTATASPLQRLAAQAWRNTTKKPAFAASRSINTTARGAKGAGAVGASARTAWSSFTRGGAQAWRNATATPNLLARIQRRNFNWSWVRRSRSAGSKPQQSLSLSARLRKLSREYGWSAVGVYLGLSVLDFPFCFLLVKWAGTERIAAIEEWILSTVKEFIPEGAKETWHEWRVAARDVEKEELGDNHVSEDVEKLGWGVEEAQERHKADASLATQLALAYAIHKSFIFIRVPLTAAVTPKVVKVLRSWGWQIGKRKPKAKR